MLIYRIFIESVVSTHSNSLFGPVKYKNDHYFLTKENEKVTSAANFILSIFVSLPKQSLDSSVHWGNRGNRVARFIWQDNLIFSLTFIKAHLIFIQINMHCTWIEQGETSEFKTFEKIGVCWQEHIDKITTALRRTLVLCCFYIAQLVTNPAV